MFGARSKNTSPCSQQGPHISLESKSMLNWWFWKSGLTLAPCLLSCPCPTLFCCARKRGEGGVKRDSGVLRSSNQKLGPKLAGFPEISFQRFKRVRVFCLPISGHPSGRSSLFGRRYLLMSALIGESTIDCGSSVSNPGTDPPNCLFWFQGNFPFKAHKMFECPNGH